MLGPGSDFVDVAGDNSAFCAAGRLSLQAPALFSMLLAPGGPFNPGHYETHNAHGPAQPPRRFIAFDGCPSRIFQAGFVRREQETNARHPVCGPRCVFKACTVASSNLLNRPALLPPIRLPD